MTTHPDIRLYTTQTPNGIKISITLEELNLPYKVTNIDLSKHAQKEPWFLEINPNGRIPTLTDTFQDGHSIRLFESGSIQQYLVQQYDKEYKISYPSGTREYYEMNNWVSLSPNTLSMRAEIEISQALLPKRRRGTNQGQSHHFTRYAHEHIPYGINRYQNETRRLYSVLNRHLQNSTSGYLVGDRCTIADIAHWGWIVQGFWAGVDIADFPALLAWSERMLARPAVEKGRRVPEKHTSLGGYKAWKADPASMDKQGAEARKCIQEGMKEDAEKWGKSNN
jgi:glutathione S-transferase